MKMGTKYTQQLQCVLSYKAQERWIKKKPN